MTDNKKLWEKIDKMPGGDRDPFETPIGPTEECLSSDQVVSFVEKGESDVNIKHHLDNCKNCSNRVKWFKIAVR